MLTGTTGLEVSFLFGNQFLSERGDVYVPSPEEGVMLLDNFRQGSTGIKKSKFLRSF